MTSVTSGGTDTAKPKKVLFYRHSVAVRITHWLNVLCLSFLLMSGLQIFNAHPYLYWGQYGSDALPDPHSYPSERSGMAIRSRA